MSTFNDGQVRSIILGLKAQLDELGASNIGNRGQAAIIALDAIGSPTSAGGDPGSPPPTNPFPPPGDPTNGASEVIRRAAYAPLYSRSWAKTKDSPLTFSVS